MTSRLRLQRALLAAFLAASLGAPLFAAIFTVTNTNDSGPGSLRQAIDDANGLPGSDEIDFAIPGDGVQTILLSTPLPLITGRVYIDGYTQPGASPNSNPPGQGFNSVIKIEVQGPGSTSIPPCFTVGADNEVIIEMVIQGLAINRCTKAILVTTGGNSAFIRQNFIGTNASGGSIGPTSVNGGIEVGAPGVRIAANLVSGTSTSGINVSDSPDSFVVGNLVGTNAAGDSVIPVAGDGIALFNSENAMIGGTTPDARNVVSGSHVGIDVGDGAHVNQVVGNFVGTDVTGTKPLGNQAAGIHVGGPHIVTGNVIAASGLGINVDTPNSVIQGNFIGTDATETFDLGNRSGGITIASTGTIVVGGTGPGDGNVIAHNGNGDDISGGIFIRGPFVTVRGNRIFDNRPLGIHFLTVPGGVTPNDPGDADIGVDGLTLQNFPIITSVVPGATTTHIVGSLNSTPAQTFDIDLFASSACPRHPHDYLQGETYLDSFQVTTDGFGDAAFVRDVPFVLAAGQPVTATATDFLGNTSEFSQRIVFSVEPPSGLAMGGTTATVHGMAFDPDVTVTVGGIPASNIVPIDAGTLTATMPGFSPGTLHTLTVSNPGGLANTLPNGWLSDFLDVPTTNTFHDFVGRLVVNGVAAGVGSGNYGVDQATLREQMAVFLLKGKHGACYEPPPCTGIFGDVDCPSTYADWIEELAAEGITAGCGNGDYCPQRPVRREEMAVFLMKAEHGATYAPPSCTGVFDDVMCPSLYADWIEQLSAEGITAGCGNGDYCPSDDTARGQMAVFVVKTFLLP